MADKKGTQSGGFSAIKTPEELKGYLDNKERLKNSPYLYHYTTIPSVIKMIRGKTWHLANAAQMNDVLEYNNGAPYDGEICFSAASWRKTRRASGCGACMPSFGKRA